MAADIDRLIQELRSLSAEEQQPMREAFAVELPSATSTSSREERADVAYQERLVQAGLLKQVNPRRRDQQAFDGFKPVEISGTPLSETIIEERR